MTAAPARLAALRVLTAVRSRNAYAHETLTSVLAKSGLDERDDRLVVGDRRIPIVDEEARGRLEPDRAGRDDQVPERDLRLEGAAGTNPDEGRPFRDRQDLRHHDLDVVGADPR
jgi:hypothetical protein